MQELIAPVYLKLPKTTKTILFANFYIRKIKPQERDSLIKSQMVDTWYSAEIQKTEFCLAKKIKGEIDWKRVNVFSEVIDNFRQSLRIMKNHSVNLSLSTTTHGFRCLNPIKISHIQSPPYEISKEDIPPLKEIYKKVEALSKDNLYKIIIERYESALFYHSSIQNKIIDLITTLESLCSKSNVEMKFRLSLTIAELLKREYSENKAKIYEKMKDFYDVRSNFVHSGKSKKFKGGMVEELTEITRKVVLLYVKKPQLFTKENLENLLIN
jgi:hypothetical protein